MRFFTFFIILVYVNVYDAARQVTNDDIRDAILSVVNMIRSSEDKLERHEFRERTLGDHIKKVLATIDKRQKLLDPVKGTIGRLDERLATVETILLQRDERERIQVQKVYEMVEQIHNSLPQLLETLKNDITSSLPKESEPPPSKIDLAKLQKEIETKIDNTSSNVKSLEGQLSKIREENKNNFSSNQKFLENYENKLTQYNKQVDVLPAKCKEANDAQTDRILKALETQNNNIQNLQKDIDASNDLVKNLEKKLSQLEGAATDKHRLYENTSQNLEHVKKHINTSHEVLKKYEDKLNEYNKKLDVLPATYKSENDAQMKSLLKAFETQNDSVQKTILTSKNEVLKNCENADKYVKEAFPHHTKALANLDATLKTDKEILGKSLTDVQTFLNDMQDLIKNKIDSNSSADKRQKSFEQSFRDALTLLKQNITNSFETKSKATVENVVKALGDQKTKYVDNLSAMEKAIKQAIQSQSESLKQLQSDVKVNLSGYDKLTKEVAKNNKAMSSDVSKEINKIADKLVTQDDLLKNIDLIAQNLTHVFNILKKHEDELIDYNNKMDALPWKHKVENDRQTQMLLEAMESLNNESFKNMSGWKDTFDGKNSEVLQVLKNIEEDNLNKTRLIDNQNKNTYKNLQTFLQAFEKELVFVTNTATSTIKDHVDRVSHAELHEFNSKIDALALNLLSENAIVKGMRSNMDDAMEVVVDQLKIIENVVNQTQNNFKETVNQDIRNNLDSIKRVVQKLDDGQEKNQDATLTVSVISQKNEQQLVELKDFLKDNFFTLSQVLQNDFIKHLKNKVDDLPTQISTFSKQNQEILQELKNSYGNSEKMHKQELEHIDSATKKVQTDTKAISKEIENHEKKLLEVKKTLEALPAKYSNENKKQTEQILKEIKENNEDIEVAIKVQLERTQEDAQSLCGDLNVKFEKTLQASNAQMKELKENLQEMPSKYSKESNKQIDAILQEIKENKKATENTKAIILAHFEDFQTNVSAALRRNDKQLSELHEGLEELPSKYLTENNKLSRFIVQEMKHDSLDAMKVLTNQLEHGRNDARMSLEDVYVKISKALLDNNKHVLALKSEFDELSFKFTSEQNQTQFILQVQNQDGNEKIESDEELEEGLDLKGLRPVNSYVVKSLLQLQKELRQIPRHISVIHDTQTQLIIEAIFLKDKELSSINNLLNILLDKTETNLNQTMENTLQTTKDQSSLSEIKDKLDYATNNLDVLTEFGKHHIDALMIIDRALENHSKIIKEHTLNQTNSSEDILKTIETHMGKLDKSHKQFSSDVKKNINATHDLIKDYRNKCNNPKEIVNILEAFKDHGLVATDAWQKTINDNQGKLVRLNKEHFANITALVDSTCKDIGKKEFKEILTLTNNTYHRVADGFDNYVLKNTKLQHSMKMIEELTETLNGNIAISFERLIDEIQGLQKLEEVMAQTSDSVTDTKRRLEYGIRDIVLEMGNLMTTHMKEFGVQVRNNFENLQTSLLDGENGAIANITASLTNDLDHVWRQIGIMHQEMIIVTDILSKIENNTESYMNSTTRNVDITRGKVTQLQNFASQIDSNLNTLLGRFSLITQEFNQIKLGLGNALNDIKRALQSPTVRSKPLGPGPHVINTT